MESIPEPGRLRTAAAIDVPNRAVWMAWHRSGRSIDLSRALGLPFRGWQLDASPLVRHPASALWTAYWLLRDRPTLVFLQHSFLLALLTALYKRLAPWRVAVVDDIHAKALRRTGPGPLRRPFAWLRLWSVAQFDLCVVATAELLEEAGTFGVPVVVLPDPLPDAAPAGVSAPRDGDTRTVVVITSFAEDEPIDEVLAAARTCPDVLFVLTGAAGREVRTAAPDNVRLPGFLPTEQYRDLIGRAGCLVALTTEDACFQRGACEAVALGQALVTSDTATLRDYLGDAAIFVAPTATQIAGGVREGLRRRADLMRRALARRAAIRAQDRLRLEELRRRVTELLGAGS